MVIGSNTLLTPTIRSPKAYAFERKGRTAWYQYYACYSAEFVEDTINFLELAPDSIILDPWNGSGTTTLVASRLGYKAIGLDINPVMVVVGKAQNIELVNASFIKKCARRFISAVNNGSPHVSDDPLLKWLQPRAARSFRQLERLVFSSELGDTTYGLDSLCLDELSSQQAFLYVGLFRTLRKIITRFASSNPTWFKRPTGYRERLSPSNDVLFDTFLHEIEDMANTDNIPETDSNGLPIPAEILLASSCDTPLCDESIDAIIASPPYCTRIDYAIATSPELAVLGYSETYLRQLRCGMIGSPTIDPDIKSINKAWGRTCSNFLKKVASHPTKASSSYYFKNHIQYFDAIYTSLSELNRVMKKRGFCTLVVQDSFYKNIHNDLPQIFTEMATSIGWRLRESFGFYANRTFVKINPQIKKYGNNAKRKEKILIFEKDE